MHHKSRKDCIIIIIIIIIIVIKLAKYSLCFNILPKVLFIFRHTVISINNNNK